MHFAVVAGIVVDRIVPAGAVVPDRNCARLPLETALIVIGQRGIEQFFEQRQTFLAGLANEVDREAAVHIEHFAARARMADHHRMDGTGFKVLPAQVLTHIGLRIKAVCFVNVIGGVKCLQVFDLVFQLIRERIISSAHMRPHRVAPFGRQMSCNQHRTHRRDLIIGMIGVPCPANIGFLIGVFLDHGDLVEIFLQREIVVHIDPAPATTEFDVIFGRKFLIAENGNTVFVDRLFDLVHFGIGAICKRDAGNLDTTFRGHRCELHLYLSAGLFYQSVSFMPQSGKNRKVARESAPFACAIQIQLLGARQLRQGAPKCPLPFNRLHRYSSLLQEDTKRVDISAGIQASLAGRYASALFELASENGTVTAVESDLQKIGAALSESEDLHAATTNPELSRAQQGDAVAAVATHLGLSELTTNFLGVLAGNRRLSKLSDMIAAFKTIAAAQRGEVTATVTSAHPLSDAQVAALKDKLTAREGRTVMLSADVDPDLLGGLVVTIGSQRIDASIRTRLNSLSQAMKA